MFSMFQLLKATGTTWGPLPNTPTPSATCCVPLMSTVAGADPAGLTRCFQTNYNTTGMWDASRLMMTGMWGAIPMEHTLSKEKQGLKKKSLLSNHLPFLRKWTTWKFRDCVRLCRGFTLDGMTSSVSWRGRGQPSDSRSSPPSVCLMLSCLAALYPFL